MRRQSSRLDEQLKATRSLLTRFFGGSADALVMRLEGDEELTVEQLAQLRKSLSRRKRKGDKGGRSTSSSSLAIKITLLLALALLS